MDNQKNGAVELRSAIRIFVFDSPRTCSHLFRKLFLQHPQLGHILEPFLVPSVLGPEGVTNDLQCTPQARDVVTQMQASVPELAKITYNQAEQMFKASLEAFELQGRTPWIKDHALYSIKPSIVTSCIRSTMSTEEVLKTHPNPTTIDYDLLCSFTPVFLIRHPALVMQSYWKVNSESIGSDVEDEQFEWMTSARWVRILFDFYSRRNGETPMVIDAQDVVNRTFDVTHAVCDRFGLDRSGVAFDWEPEPLSDAPGEFFKTRLRASKGVESHTNSVGKQEINLDTMVAGWKAKYGEDIGNALRQRVDAELPDYQYLHQFKLLK